MNLEDNNLGVGDRLKESPAPELVLSAYAVEAGNGPLLCRSMSLADMAHAIMLIEEGIIPQGAGARLLSGLTELFAIPPKEFPFDPARGDCYTNRTYVLHQIVPEAAGWLQAGRPRREVTTIAFLMVVRERLLILCDTLLDLMVTLLDLAESNLDTIMPDYTYLQAAQPTTFAHYLLNFVQPITRDLSRLVAAYGHTNQSPAGSGSTNGTRLPLDRRRLADLLGFEGVVTHTRDAMWQPDEPIEVMSMIVAMMVNVNRLAEDLQIWATAEFNFVEVADRHSRISAIMPQKKNPYSLAFVRGVARDMIGWLVSSATVGATPSGQVDNRIFIYGDVPKALERSRQAIRLLAGTLKDLTLNRDVMARRAAEGFVGATDLTDVIMLECKINSQNAHRIVGNAVRRAIDSGDRLTPEILDLAAVEIINKRLGFTDEQIATVMNPEMIIQNRTGLGSAGLESVQQMIRDSRDVNEGYRNWHAGQANRLAVAERELLKRSRELCQST